MDAITLSLARMSRDQLKPHVVVHGIVIAAMVNTLVKGVLFLSLSRSRSGIILLGSMILVVLTGGLTILGADWIASLPLPGWLSGAGR